MTMMTPPTVTMVTIADADATTALLVMLINKSKSKIVSALDTVGTNSHLCFRIALRIIYELLAITIFSMYNKTLHVTFITCVCAQSAGSSAHNKHLCFMAQCSLCARKNDFRK